MSAVDVSREPGFVDSQLIPVMREAVMTVQMIVFKVLKASVHDRYVDQIEPYHTQLAGAVINNLFGTQPLDAAVAVFATSNRHLVERELRELSNCCGSLIPVLTDALRMKTICDNQEGIHSIPSLLMAKALGLLLEDRPLPLPSTFMMQVRHLAAEHGLVEPMQAAPLPAVSPA
jgi:replicative DNA helicase